MYDTEKEIKVKEYINKYLNELQRHFDMPDKKMRLIIYDVYKDLSPLSKLSCFIKKHISMVKSFCVKKFNKVK